MSERFSTTHTRTRTRSKSRSPSRNTQQLSRTENAIRQLKLIVPGACLTYYFGTIDRLLALVQTKDDPWKSKITLAALGNGVVMIALFLYVLVLIYRRGENPDWRTWRQSGSLATIIPVLTTTIIAGWLLHAVALGKWSGLGYVQGFIGASALYALVFGLLALLPSPRKGRGH